MKKDKINKIKVKTETTFYYKDKGNKTIFEIALKLIENEISNGK